MDVPTCLCPNCSRLWPVVSEQGASVSMYGKCFGCIAASLADAVGEARAEAPYTIENCPRCGGLQPALCEHCNHHGWLAVPK